MKSGELDKISLASEWCPSLRSSFENSTLFTESIARKVYPRNSYPEYEGVEEAHYAKRIRHRLRKEFLSPLRKALESPEVYIGSNKLDSLPYDRVSSLDMKKYKKFFIKHDEERFKKYLESVKRGDAKIAAGELLPCEIYEGTGCIVAELQWQRMVSDLLEKGRLKDCLAICDVSGSMVGPPLQASLALGLLISEISEHPWKGKLITFNNHSQLQEIKGDDLCSKRMFVRSIKWNMPTDFQKVFDTILQVAIDGNLKEDQVIKRVFVFSDMRFDKASKNYFEWAADYPTLDTAFSWETDYETIKRKFRESGYMSVPEIVFWNLRSSGATPVTWEQNGVAMVSGFSKNMLNLFIDENGSPTYLSSGNPLLDFFFHVVPDTPSESVIKRLELAWECDPLRTLKLICNLRGVRGTGKSEKEGFYAAALWLFKHHPKTLAANVKSFAEFGYFKDLPEILHRITEEGQEMEEMEICVTK
ncbi:hypothetical protein C5167_020058 [Papaver somniferum]|uniref:DUF2828 domain-containing protein n=1 Tax=Papaver somniferum TaxID=3469 RepID=A0A4Y7IVA0_PAPSO|nr:hypothetical protein C5167_020058 [Papaver somniferum]